MVLAFGAWWVCSAVGFVGTISAVIVGVADPGLEDAAFVGAAEFVRFAAMGIASCLIRSIFAVKLSIANQTLIYTLSVRTSGFMKLASFEWWMSRNHIWINPKIDGNLRSRGVRRETISSTYVLTSMFDLHIRNFQPSISISRSRGQRKPIGS